MHRWIVTGIGIATVILASVYQHWIVAAAAAIVTLFVLFRNPQFEPSARSSQRGRPGGGDADGGDGGGD